MVCGGGGGAHDGEALFGILGGFRGALPFQSVLGAFGKFLPFQSSFFDQMILGLEIPRILGGFAKFV